MSDEVPVPADALVTLVVRFHAMVYVIAAAELLIEEADCAGPPVLIDSIQHIRTALRANCSGADGRRPDGRRADPDFEG